MVEDLPRVDDNTAPADHDPQPTEIINMGDGSTANAISDEQTTEEYGLPPVDDNIAVNNLQDNSATQGPAADGDGDFTVPEDMETIKPGPLASNESEQGPINQHVQPPEMDLGISEGQSTPKQAVRNPDPISEMLPLAPTQTQSDKTPAPTSAPSKPIESELKAIEKATDDQGPNITLGEKIEEEGEEEMDVDDQEEEEDETPLSATKRRESEPLQSSVIVSSEIPTQTSQQGPVKISSIEEEQEHVRKKRPEITKAGVPRQKPGPKPKNKLVEVIAVEEKVEEEKKIEKAMKVVAKEPKKAGRPKKTKVSFGIYLILRVNSS